MNSDLMQTVCRTGIFVICAQALVHFRPNASYEKYMKMLVSAIILLQLLLPVSDLFAGGEGQRLEERVEWFEEQLRMGMERAGRQYGEGAKSLEHMTLEEVRGQLAESSAEAAADEAERTDLDEAERIAPIEPIRVELPGEGGAEDDRE